MTIIDSAKGMDRTENAVALKLLLSDGMTHSIVACAAIGTDCAEDTILVLMFTGLYVVTAGCCDSTILTLSEYAIIKEFIGIFLFMYQSTRRDIQ
jgi:hypothetical protein